MTETARNVPEPDLIDRIANALPAEVRADYYRELTHCRSLPENDEMLRILRAILFLSLLMEQVPGRVVAERERLESLFNGHIESARKMLASVLGYHRQLDERLTRLPKVIASGISPEAIASSINESLRQQFVASTLPQTAKALALTAADMKTTAAEFKRNADSIGDAYHGSAEAARRAITEMVSTISRTTETTRRAVIDLTVTFRRTYRLVITGLSCLALVAGIIFGMLLFRHFDPPDEVERATTSAPPPAPKVNHPGPPPSKGKP
jgi:hypothetical protein